MTISGGTITATGAVCCGIGGGLDGNGTVIITDGDITAKATGRYGAGIGGGCGEIPKGTLIGGMALSPSAAAPSPKPLVAIWLLASAAAFRVWAQ